NSSVRGERFGLNPIAVLRKETNVSRLWIVKCVVAASFVIGAIFFVVPRSLSKTDAPRADSARNSSVSNPDDYVGSETCKGCHDAEFTSFSKTTHSRLSKAGWKSERQGCESCHGPGKAHVDGGGDKTKITTFENATAKKISETCLTCHAGKEEHNNFRRGEHWRNDIGCTDCHSPHTGSHPQAVEPKGDGSSSLFPVGPFAAHASDFAPKNMLKKHEVLLCMTCHNETKAQFNMPFHHRVLEGAMKCSDCHNPHGGFELKQVRLATGADAACFKCHADKQGPFVFEHAPLKVEGCTACHDVHGSASPKLLKRSSVAQLCIECHSNIGTVPGEEASGAAQVPHDLSNQRYRNCTICHSKIHGSNASNRFFR
ncbi:MAG TPA: DmsE family decaheme c-type cytochrome, partial [Blastocatellia bacterium]|nr:DmsE family decaheme c-type cytochrome [Blastocatellia bacterium]